MRAALRRKYGNADTLAIETIEKPKPKKGEVLIRVHATTVNRTDCAILTGKPFIMRLFLGFINPSSHSIGTDFAGEVEAIGEGVQVFKVGDKVWGFEDQGLGSQATYMTYAANKNISLLPLSISYEDAVASLEGAHYAINTINKVDIPLDSKILINGATGAIGNALLQILKSKGIKVTAVCDTKNMECIKSLGADRIINYEIEDFTQDDSSKYDFIFDAVGKSSFGKCKPLLNNNGVYISSELGAYGQNIFYALTTSFFSKKKVIFPIPSDIKMSMKIMKQLLEEGKFKPIIDRQYPLANITDAYEYVSSGQKTGNVIIRV